MLKISLKIVLRVFMTDILSDNNTISMDSSEFHFVSFQQYLQQKYIRHYDALIKEIIVKGCIMTNFSDRFRNFNMSNCVIVSLISDSSYEKVHILKWIYNILKTSVHSLLFRHNCLTQSYIATANSVGYILSIYTF